MAELAGATLWSADQRLLGALGGALPFVCWIGDHPALEALDLGAELDEARHGEVVVEGERLSDP